MADETGFSRTHPAGFVVQTANNIRQAILPIVALVFGSQGLDAPLWAILAGGIAILAINIGAAWLGWRHLRYRVGSDDIRVERGIVNKEARSVPYDRIQDVSLEESLLARMLGLVEVRFETGAGAKEELKLAYLAKPEGERLRQTVRSRRDAAPATAPVEAQPEATLIFAMDNRRLFTFGLFEFSLLVFALLGAAAQQLDFLLPGPVWEGDFWRGLFAQQGALIEGLGIGLRILGVVAALAVLIVVGLVTGLLRTFLRDYDFRLERTDKGFRRRRGLLTRTDVVMPVHRVQAAEVATGAVRRLLGWHSLSFVSLASDGSSEPSHVAAPFAKMDEIAPIAAIAGIALPDAGTGWHRADRRRWIDRGLVLAMLLLAVAAVLAFTRFWPFAAVPLAALPLVAGAQALGWLRHRHALDGAILFARSGLLSPRLTAAPQVKLQSVEVAQGPLARMRGYADVHFGLAGGSLAIEGLPLAQAERVRADVLKHIAAVDFADLPR